MLQKAIDKLYNSNDLFELAGSIEKLLSAIDSVRNKNKVLREIYGNLYFGCTRQPQPFSILEGKDASIPYLMTYWRFHETYKDNKKCLQDIIHTIHASMLPPQKSRISIEMIQSLIALVNDKFHFQQKVLEETPLEILLIDHSHTELGAYYVAILTEDSPESIELTDKIFIPYLRHEINFPQEFIFLHELGHALHTRATKQLMTPPDSFLNVLERIFPKAVYESDTIKAELFADSFAIAALHNSDFSQYDSVIKEEDRLFLIGYMQNLIETTF
ncbi:hypothetical protein [Oscillibacter sp.]|uniref:hypothetical protein n=1 Tax=Oscillibacter sp. TaxID=1945593 RepID=UPI00289CB39C|nr:hypothetical protein [Oscillibacter sp.]